MSQLSAPVNPEDLGRGPLIMGLTWTFASLALIAVALRLHVRIKLSKRLALDDWLMCAAIAFNMISQSFVTVGYHYGLGKHDANLKQDQMIKVLKWMWLANTPGLLVSILARISIAVLLVRLFGIYLWLKWFLLAVTSMCTILTLIILPCTYLQSTPVSGNWDPFVPAKHWDTRIYISLAFLSQSLWTFTDLTFVLFPVLVIWRLQMDVKKRIALVLLMSASLFTMALSILKTLGLKHIADQQVNPNATNVQYDATLEILWSCLEQAFVIIMGCVPPLRSITRLGWTQSVSDSLASILHWGKFSKLSSKPTMYKSREGTYEDLEMMNNRVDLVRGGSIGLPCPATEIYEERYTGSQQTLVRKTAATATTETSATYSLR